MRTTWPIAPGEEARLTPDGPSAAEVVSQGALPLRVRQAAAGVHHRPSFPGSTLVVGERPFEVVEEIVSDRGVVYRLDPWPGDQVIRLPIEYGPAFVQAVQEERRRIRQRRNARTYAWLLAPLVGMLDEDQQIRVCDRLGLDPVLTTMTSGLCEIMVVVAVLSSAADVAGPAAPVLAAWASVVFVSLALMRVLGALLLKEVAGTPLVVIATELLPHFRRAAEPVDPTLLPLTRTTFWARLRLPDRQQREEDGTWLISGALPHVSWEQDRRVQVGGEWWSVTTLPPARQGGRLVYAYRLAPYTEEVAEGESAPCPPRPTAYQEEVLAEVDAEWGDFLSAFSWVVSLFPAAVQRRAVGRRGGVRAVRKVTLRSAGFCVVASLWFFAGPGVLNFATGVALLVDGAQRLWRAQRGQYAPSLVGGFIADYVRPERHAYHLHRDADRRARAG